MPSDAINKHQDIFKQEIGKIDSKNYYFNREIML